MHCILLYLFYAYHSVKLVADILTDQQTNITPTPNRPIDEINLDQIKVYQLESFIIPQYNFILISNKKKQATD